VFVNCLFTDNLAGTTGLRGEGGAVYSDTDGTPDLINCTITQNAATDSSSQTGVGGLFHANECPMQTPTKPGAMNLTNCIVWNNGGIELEARNLVKHTIIEELTEICGNPDGNSDEDPDFQNASGGDFRLSSGSPSIDAGINSAVDDFTDSRDINQDGKTIEVLPDLDLRQRLPGGRT
jgi:hypothetical protein